MLNTGFRNSNFSRNVLPKLSRYMAEQKRGIKGLMTTNYSTPKLTYKTPVNRLLQKLKSRYDVKGYSREREV